MATHVWLSIFQHTSVFVYLFCLQSSLIRIVPVLHRVYTLLLPYVIKGSHQFLPAVVLLRLVPTSALILIVFWLNCFYLYFSLSFSIFFVWALNDSGEAITTTTSTVMNANESAARNKNQQMVFVLLLPRFRCQLLASSLHSWRRINRERAEGGRGQCVIPILSKS